MMFRMLLAALCVLQGLSAGAADLPPPAGPVVLTVTGRITQTNVGDTAQFDQAMLDALPQRTTHAVTPWLDGRRAFSGPRGSALLDAVGAAGARLRVVALNDYAADVPVRDLRDFDVILATAIDGARLNVRDKGPLFLIYPFDDRPELFNEVYFGRSVWQIARIDVLD